CLLLTDTVAPPSTTLSLHDALPIYLTDVGAYTGTTSPYGAFDMGGNVVQWNEGLIGGSARGVRGGSFGDPSFPLQSSIRGNGNRSEEHTSELQSRENLVCRLLLEKK